jgi:hypothetical protein
MEVINVVMLKVLCYTFQRIFFLGYFRIFYSIGLHHIMQCLKVHWIGHYRMQQICLPIINMNEHGT